MNVEKISLHKKEKEILLTPYHRYKFVTSVDSKSIFLILPTDLTIPNTFAEFADWKLDKGAKPAHLSGGRLATLNHRPIAFKNTTLKKKLNRNRVSMATTRKRMNSNSKTIETSGFYERLTAPIPSFEGKQPTKEEQKVIDQMVDMIRQIESGEKSSARNHT
jgi:hypothetical protein